MRIVVTTLAALLLAGCQSRVVSGDGRPMPPEPRRAPKTPAGARANTLFLRVGAKAIDTNGNGYPDLIPVEAHLFAEPHPSPIFERGTMIFCLYPDGRPINSTPMAQWRIDPDEMETLRMRSALGLPGYGFRLSLLDIGGDNYPLMRVNLTGRFEPADGGTAVTPSEPYSLQIGRK